MAYQNPSYSFLHAAADAGAAAMTENATVDTSYPENNLIDYRPSSLFKWSNSAANHWIKIDRGAAGLEQINRLIIPAGHNLSTATFILQHSTADSWNGASTNAVSDTFGTGLQDFSFTASTEQWWRLYITGTGAWEIGQLVLTNKRTPTRGIDPDWTRLKIASVVKIPFPSRDVSLTTAPTRWLYRVRYNHVDATDLAIFDELFEETGSAVPFYFDQPVSGGDPLLMGIQGDPDIRQDHTSPSGAGAPTYRVEFTMLEQTA